LKKTRGVVLTGIPGEKVLDVSAQEKRLTRGRNTDRPRNQRKPTKRDKTL